MTVYHNKDNLMNGPVKVEWQKLLLCTCDGTDRDEKYIIEMLRDTIKRWDGKDWTVKIVKVHPTAWRVVSHDLRVLM